MCADRPPALYDPPRLVWMLCGGCLLPPRCGRPAGPPRSTSPRGRAVARCSAHGRGPQVRTIPVAAVVNGCRPPLVASPSIPPAPPPQSPPPPSIPLTPPTLSTPLCRGRRHVARHAAPLLRQGRAAGPRRPGQGGSGGGEARPRPKLAPRTPVLPPVSVDGRLHPHHRVGECAGRADHHHQQRLDRHPRGHGLGGGRSTPLARHATPSQLPELRNPLSSPPSPTLACTGPSLGALGRPRHRLWPLLHHRPPQMAQGGGVGPAVLPPPTPPTPDPRRRRHPRRAGDPRPLPVPPLPSAEPPPRRAHLHRHGRQACRGKGARHRWGWGG